MNAVRSPMACAIFQHLTSNAFSATSAGVRPGYADPFVVAVMDEIGIDLSDHQPRGLSSVSEQTFDHIISLSPEAHHHAIELTRVMVANVQYWPTPDVTTTDDRINRREKLERYRTVRDVLFQRVKNRFSISGGPTV